MLAENIESKLNRHLFYNFKVETTTQEVVAQTGAMIQTTMILVTNVKLQSPLNSLSPMMTLRTKLNPGTR